jgi:hypothetical protein
LHGDDHEGSDLDILIDPPPNHFDGCVRHSSGTGKNAGRIGRRFDSKSPA